MRRSAHVLGVRVTRLTGTMPCDRLLHQGSLHIVHKAKVWSRHR
ncbi:hypothetical protein STXM2123_4896 [Streptomyces sp. F-3]|nr:hypothetical protein STXM2123_4896 [Streptomyces sp. F-3]